MGYRPGLGHSSPPALEKDTDIRSGWAEGCGWGRWGLREVAVIAIRHPAYLTLTDGECGVPHRGVTACNDIRGTMRPDTHFSAPILPGHRLAPLLDPSPPLISPGISPSILAADKELRATISESKAQTPTNALPNTCTCIHVHIATEKKHNEETSKNLHI